jgi:hypothetical protein
MGRADESRASEMATAIILSPIIAGVTVALRIYTRRALVKVRFFEDYCIICAMLCSLAMSGFMGTSVIYGFGRHIETVSDEELVEQGKVAIGGIIFYVLTHMALKLSILLQYVRISVMPFEKTICYVLIGILVSQSLAIAGIHLGLCRPFYALWTSNVEGAVCLDRTKVYYAQLGITIAMDFLVLIAPLFILRHLTLPWMQKFLILMVLSFGGMCVTIPQVLFPRTCCLLTLQTQGLHHLDPPPPYRCQIHPIQGQHVRKGWKRTVWRDRTELGHLLRVHCHPAASLQPNRAPFQPADESHGKQRWYRTGRRGQQYHKAVASISAPCALRRSSPKPRG